MSLLRPARWLAIARPHARPRRPRTGPDALRPLHTPGPRRTDELPPSDEPAPAEPQGEPVAEGPSPDDPPAAATPSPPRRGPPPQPHTGLALADRAIARSWPPPFRQRRGRRAARFAEYTAEEEKALDAEYTPEQRAAIAAGEAAVDLTDLIRQAAPRTDPWQLPYLDDLAGRRPYIDREERDPEGTGYDPNLRFKSNKELAADLRSWVDGLDARDRAAGVADDPEKSTIDRADWLRFQDSTRLTVGKASAELGRSGYEASALPKLDDPAVRQVARASQKAAAEDEHSAPYERLARRTGLSVAWMRALRSKELVQRRVVNQTRMGKVARQYFLVVAGDGQGLLGLGEGKGVEPEDAKRQALLNAIRNLQPIPRYERRTIYGDVRGKVGATELELFTRPPGFGIRAQARIHEMCKCAGISDVAARVTRARNPMNTVKAAFAALRSQRDPEQVARARGLKMVDVRKVYYGGMV